jgi:predicted TPR repeat methyltransferase
VPDDEWLVSGSTSTEEVRGYYDEQAPTYDRTLAGWGYDAPWRVAELLLQLLPADRAQQTVLDAGCGTGLAGRALRDAGFGGRLLGIDLSSDSVALAIGRGIYDHVVVGDLQQPLEYGDGSVDGVVCVGVLTYVPDVAAIWGELCRVTRRGGTIVLTQRDDIWRERQCNAVLHELERAGRWAVVHLSPPASYLPGNADFGAEILVRYLAARVR